MKTFFFEIPLSRNLYSNIGGLDLKGIPLLIRICVYVGTFGNGNLVKTIPVCLYRIVKEMVLFAASSE